MAHVLTLAGSPARPSRTEQLLHHVGHRLSRGQGNEAGHGTGHRIRHLAVRDLPAEALLAADHGHPAIRRAVASVADADALVIGSPVYKAAYSGLLKVFLDVLPRTALRGKPVLPLLTGGSPAHVLALDYALRPVLTALGGDTVLRGWFVLDRHITTGRAPEAEIRLAAEAEPGLAQAVGELADALTARHSAGIPLTAGSPAA